MSTLTCKLVNDINSWWDSKYVFSFVLVSKNSKFGVVQDDFKEVLDILVPCKWIKIIGLHCHLGSTIDDVTIYSIMFKMLEKVLRDDIY